MDLEKIPRTLDTRDLHLRPSNPTDAAGMFAMLSDPESMKYWSDKPIKDLDAAVEVLNKDLESDIGSCPIDDDVGEILRKVIAADGIILSSPVHNGFITGLMTVFFERMAWRLCRPTGRIMTFRGAPESRSKKARALATIVSAGSMPTKLGEKYCNDGTPFMKQNGCLILNADWVGSVYAGGEFSKKLQGDDWQRAYFFKELSEQQIKQAHDLGLKMAEKINADSLRPLHPFGRLGPFLDTVTGWFIRE